MILWLKQIQRWFKGQKEVIEDQNSLQELPSETQAKIQEYLSTISHPQKIIEGIKNSIEEATDRWLYSASSPNSLIILGNPVEPINEFIQEAIKQWQTPQNLPINCLCLPPATNPAERQQQLVEELQKVSVNSRTESQQQLYLIPNLSNCFIRCIGGLDGMNILRDKVAEDKQKFWIIGCHNWAWEYLDKTNQIQADFEQTFSIPNLDGNELKLWLKPAIDNLYIDIEEKEDEFQKDFEKLAKISLGLSEVAKELWFICLGCEQQEQKQEDEDIESSLLIKIAWQNLPKQPKISEDDRYVIYSLLLHQQLSLDCLAITLGEEKNLVNSHVRKLKELDLIQENFGLLKINQVYYPQLAADLKQNKFLDF
ncbi:MAG: hypothetical protein SWX82_00810 [Cyanobacteriota bacterium]|nr:hypothetical protein [Cyanobacteriota bacterium]